MTEDEIMAIPQKHIAVFGASHCDDAKCDIEQDAALVDHWRSRAEKAEADSRDWCEDRLRAAGSF